ncbi:MAG: glycosyltransferase family 1 protein [Anaerolineaceae bacterium]|nr:glycosyltransferase family 1 protein [Anaerolineaceae bacterium]
MILINPLKIGFDASVIALNQAGTGTYTRNLLRSLVDYFPDDEFIPFMVKQLRDMSRAKTLRTRLDSLYRDILWQHIKLPLEARKAKVELLHNPAGYASLATSSPQVVTIYDTTILQSPNNFPFWHRNYARLMVPYAARHAAAILTISECSKRDIIQWLRVPAEKIYVTYLAASPSYRHIGLAPIETVKQKYGLDQFILTVGTLEPRKNISSLIKAYQQIGNIDPRIKLVHAGPLGWMYADILKLVKELGLDQQVRFLGRVSEEDLIGLYNAARLFVFPSLYEGFGLPVLEAMACNCPVVTSNNSSLVEVAGDAACLIDPMNIGDIASGMINILDDANTANCLRAAGLKQSAKFTWEKCARETYTVYEKVCGGN